MKSKLATYAVVVISIFFFGIHQRKEKESTSKKSFDSISDTVASPQDTFELWYSYAGLGSGFGSMEPVFRTKGTKYSYSLEQNSYNANIKPLDPEKICSGNFRISSVDSIVRIVKGIKDTLINVINPNIRSGGIHSISIKLRDHKLEFYLHNSSDTSAQKIVDILNSNIPENKRKLFLFGLHETKNSKGPPFK